MELPRRRPCDVYLPHGAMCRFVLRNRADRPEGANVVQDGIAGRSKCIGSMETSSGFGAPTAAEAPYGGRPESLTEVTRL